MGGLVFDGDARREGTPGSPAVRFRNRPQFKLIKNKFMQKISLYFDGSCEPINPGGTMGFGTLIKQGEIRIFENSEAVAAAPGNTNNIAEYQALIKGLQWLIDNGMTSEPVAVFGDSNLVIQQMAGNWGAKGGRYYPYYVKAKSLRDQFSDISFTWIPRSENVECDELSRSANTTAQ